MEYRRRLMGKKSERKQYLTFTALEAGTFTFSAPDTDYDFPPESISYSINGGVSWVTNAISNNTSITTPRVAVGDTVLWKGTLNSTLCSTTDGEDYYCQFSSTGKFDISGDILSLYYEDSFIHYTTFNSTFDSNAKNLFEGCAIVNAKDLILPTVLRQSCYSGLFYDCNYLVSVPELPATTLEQGCYNSMFQGCTSLTTAPELPATSVVRYCYSNMFKNCTSLAEAPNLPATVVTGDNSYSGMFEGCTSLTSTPTISLVNLNSYTCRSMFKGCTNLTDASNITISSVDTHSCLEMFSGCTKLAAAPTLSATTLAIYCYYSMFNNCTSLVTAPILPAITLVSNCYYRMFYNCSNLQYIKAMFTTKPTTSYTSNWVYNVKSSGTFVKNSAATWSVKSAYGIPKKWTVTTASS